VIVWAHSHIREISTKTTIEQPDELSREVKAAAALRGQSVKQYLTELLGREPSGPLRGRNDEAVRKQRCG
jgi:hypothetical protein